MKSLLQAAHDEPEMRAIERSYVEIAAFYMPETGAPVSCLVTNISPMGAQVNFPGAGEVPDVIRLRVPSIGMVYRGEVRWQEGDTLGLHFVAAERL